MVSARLPASLPARLPAQWVTRVVRRQDKHPLVSVEMRGNISSDRIAAYYAFDFSFCMWMMQGQRRQE